MKPIILDYAIDRKGDDNPIFEYDYQRSMNVITLGSKKRAFIESKSSDLALLTSTRIKTENDDSQTNMLELQTNTKVKQEQDDDNKFLLELRIKTFVKRERDDEGFDYL